MLLPEPASATAGTTSTVGKGRATGSAAPSSRPSPTKEMRGRNHGPLSRHRRKGWGPDPSPPPPPSRCHRRKGGGVGSSRRHHWKGVGAGSGTPRAVVSARREEGTDLVMDLPLTASKNASASKRGNSHRFRRHRHWRNASTDGCGWCAVRRKRRLWHGEGAATAQGREDKEIGLG